MVNTQPLEYFLAHDYQVQGVPTRHSANNDKASHSPLPFAVIFAEADATAAKTFLTESRKIMHCHSVEIFLWNR